MYRLLIVLAVVCGHLANATTISSETTTTDRYVTTDGTTEAAIDDDWPSYTEPLEALSKLKGWFEKTYAKIRDKITGYIYGEAEIRATPPYEDLCTADVPFGYEARSYNASVWVSVDLVNVSAIDAVLLATPKLEAYFNGKNDRNLTINMTTPLRMTRPRPRTLPPGTDEKTVMRYSLYLPPEWHENPPKPLDTRKVVLRREPPTRYFVKAFSSSISSLNYKELFLLESLLNERKEQFVGDQFFVNVYDPIFNRPDEVMLLVKPSVVKPACKVDLSDLRPVEQMEPKYVELCKDNKNYEARLYFRAAWVSTTVNSTSPQLAELMALPLLDKYFNRYNDYGALMPKTKPVRLTVAWPTSTSNPDISRDYTFSYFVPFDPAYTIPQPLDDDVVILDEPASTIFAMRFGGFSFDPYKMEKLHELRTYLVEEKEDYMTSDPVVLEFYDSQSFLGLYNHNEVLVRMDPSAKQPKCLGEAIPPCYHRGKHCPSYRIMETFNGDIEHRRLSGSLYVMKKTQTCIMDEAYSDAYMPLHRYFYGGNSKQEKMTRTTPVILVHKSTENPPLGCDFSYNLMFYLPPDQHLDPPEPIEDGIELTRHESKEAYVITFANATTEEVVAAKENELRTQLDKRGICYRTDEFFIATYDAPWRTGAHRYEIWIPQATCTASTPSVQGLGHNMVQP